MKKTQNQLFYKIFVLNESFVIGCTGSVCSKAVNILSWINHRETDREVNFLFILFLFIYSYGHTDRFSGSYK